MKSKFSIKNNFVLATIVALVISFIVFYIYLPPINLYSIDFYMFLTVVVIVFLLSYYVFFTRNKKDVFKFSKIGIGILAIGWGIFLIMNLFSLVPFHARRYANIIKKEDGIFSEDVEQVDFDRIPVVDRDTAVKLGSRKMGEIEDLVSQYDIDQTYSQATVNGKPMRNTPLIYSDIIKWLKNSKNGIPYYISVDMVEQDVELKKLEKPIKYSFSDKFSRDIKRHMRFKYPTALIDEINFETDDEGHPFWVASTVKPTVGLIGGMDANSVIVVDAVTGDTNRYKVGDVPEWIDRVYSADRIVEQLTWNGRLQGGFINQYFGQRGVTEPTDGYNYLSLGNDIYLYTGITSVLADESNIGFVLVNMRTKETKFFPVSSADEKSAMASAEGAVQEKGYNATFPILINLYNRPTYFLSLKDNAGLIKTFAFIDAQNYQNVATGSTIEQALAIYDSTNIDREIDESALEDMEITVREIYPVTIEGNTSYFIRADGSELVFVAPIKASTKLPFVKIGDKLNVTGENLGTQFNINSIKD
ncbi:hypothetical protein [Miniphocaeibacter halophilus]|uniref:Uncharacterized protein n=1 Tax=Miniphocaeibacter halophilus TaxID=2931922 RepID=A0AC61MRQ9_9FIRM|nr:hypothetical protein [Miniphocaeibacter halophilus]QQK06993.1 hypothetical protein JFY71_06495 [Miniphocaeibacter halophilus]